MSPTTVLMCGLPASGKTTVAGRLAALTGGALVRQCDVYRELGVSLPQWVARTRGFTVGVDRYDAVRDRAYDEMARRLAAHLAAGDDPVIVDAVHGERAKRRRVYGVCAAAGATPLLVWCRCDDARQTRERLAVRVGREHEPEREASHAAVWRDIARRWEDPAGEVPAIVCDTVGGGVSALGEVDRHWLALVGAAVRADAEIA